jgi:hypothetical protein
VTDIYGAPSCTFAAFLAHLRAHPSPALPDAADIWNLLVDAAVDPTFALAMFHHESSCGLAGRAVATRSWGNIRWRPQYETYARERGLRDLDGFVAYPDYAAGARHVVDHLRGLDGTNSYAGKVTIEQVIPTWAPAGDGNSPPDYIAAMMETYRELQADQPRPPASGPRILLVAGHIGIENITAAGLRSWRDVAKLRGGTGAGGEREVNIEVANLLQRALLNRGLDVVVTDAVYHPELYEDPRGWALCLAIHAHRDANQHGRFAIPDTIAPPFLSDAALARSRDYRALFRQHYSDLTGILVDQADLGTIGMRQLYTWDFVPLETPSGCLELGHLEDDAAVLLEPNHRRVVQAVALITTRWLGMPDVAAPPPTPTPPPAPSTELADTLDQLIALAQRARAQLDEGR